MATVSGSEAAMLSRRSGCGHVFSTSMLSTDSLSSSRKGGLPFWLAETNTPLDRCVRARCVAPSEKYRQRT